MRDVWIGSLDALDLLPAMQYIYIYIHHPSLSQHQTTDKKKKRNMKQWCTHLMNRLYAEGTLCFFSAAVSHQHTHTQFTLIPFLTSLPNPNPTSIHKPNKHERRIK